MEYEASMRNLLEDLLRDENASPTDLPITLLKAITKNFSDDLQIGHGGFAVVYKGLLGNGRTIAVKKLSNSIDMDEKTYNQEVGCLMRVKHKNIVRFLGYCADTQGKMCDYGGKFVMADVRQRLLCFEYLPRGNLEQYITSTSDGLEWRKRYQIMKGICEGLHYLHGQRIVHLDLKPANILLDDDMVPKIADFGLSRCFEENQTKTITSKLAGSLGYLAPEFFCGVVTLKLDIYSLGVIIMELLVGQKGYTAVECVLEFWRDTLNGSSEEILLEQIRVCAEIGIECIDSDPAKRPTIQQIIQGLNETESIDGFIKNDMTTTATTQIQSTDSDKVKLETMTRIKSIPWTVACYEFPVLVRLKGPSRCMESSRVGVDLVAVLGDCTESIKQGMMFVIDNLGPNDRLSIVTFEQSQVHRCTDLSVMSDMNREEARTKVLKLKAGQGKNMSLAIQEAYTILQKRGVERSRVGRVILVQSHVEDSDTCETFREHMSREFPVDIFGLGNAYGPAPITMYEMANKTSGAYSYVIADIDVALAQYLGGITSVTAIGVEINIQTEEGVTISSIHSGGYKVTINPGDCRSGTVLVHDFYAGEQKDFIVWLSVPEGTRQLMTVSGCYRNPKIKKEATIQLDSSEVVILRPTGIPPLDQTVCPEVAAELVRSQLVKGLCDTVKLGIYSLDELGKLWDAIRGSKDWRMAPESNMLGLARDVTEMLRGFTVRNHTPVPFILSWLSSHMWQRATTKGSPSRSGAFRTATMEEMLRRLYYPHLEGQTHEDAKDAVGQ